MSTGTSSINISQHAFERARERLGWSARALRRMTDRVFGFGLAADDLAGSVQRYMEEKESVAGAITRNYGEHLFVFRPGATTGDLTLVTVWPLPGEYRGLLRRARRKAIRG